MSLVLRGVKRFIQAMDPRRARARLEAEQVRRMSRAVALLRGDVIEYINSEKHGVPNSPLTILTKGSERPLVDRGDLRQAISTAVESAGNVVRGAVGVLRTARRGRGGRFKTSAANVAAALHEGFTVKVTDAVRRAVFAEMRRRRGKRAKPARVGGGGAKTWRVRGRPFIRDPLDAAAERIAAELGDGVRTTLRGL